MGKTGTYIKSYHYYQHSHQDPTKKMVPHVVKCKLRDPWFLTHSKKERPAKDIYSSRFGYINLYKRKEQANLICPSGYSVSQCMNRMRKLWLGYKRAKSGEKLEQMKKYARMIQETQKDMGIATSSFPFLGIFGDRLVLYDKKDKTKRKERELKHEDYVESQKLIKIKQQVAADEEIQTMVDDKLGELPAPMQEPPVPILLEPASDEEIVVMADEIPFMKCTKCEHCGEYIYFGKVHDCVHDLEIQVLTDNVPFQTRTEK